MIQRIQSVYLLITAILMAVLCFVPFTQFLREGELFRQTVWGIWSTGESAVMVVKTIPMGILTVLSVLLPLVVIFLYRRRGLQMRLCVVEMILLVGVLIYMGMYLFRTGSDTISDRIAFSVVDLCPVLALVFVFLAFKRVMRDDILVKSLDRIR